LNFFPAVPCCSSHVDCGCGLIRVFYHLSQNYAILDQKEVAIFYGQHALNRVQNDTDHINDHIKVTLGHAHFRLLQYKDAYKNFVQVYKLRKSKSADQFQSDHAMANCYVYLAMCQRKVGCLDIAVKNFNKAIEIIDKTELLKKKTQVENLSGQLTFKNAAGVKFVDPIFRLF
jgi:tetratricopeptide (TPR) repeat protein